MQVALEKIVSETGIKMDNDLDQVTSVCVCAPTQPPPPSLSWEIRGVVGN
jgi:hypothetical protein